MPAIAPRLTAEDLRAELTRFHSCQHRTLHTAFYGTGQAEPIKVTIQGGEQKWFRVVPVDCELRLREELSRRSEEDPLVLLVDYTERLPIDVEGRLAHGGLILISRERRLATLFGRRSVSPIVLEDKPLVEALLRDGRPFPGRNDGNTVDEHTAWRAYLERTAGLSALGDLSEELVLEHFASSGPPASDAFTSVDGLSQAALAYLGRVAGPIAGLAFEAWLRGRGIEVAALSFVIESLADQLSEGYVLAFLEGLLDELKPGLQLETKLLSRWKALTSALALRLENRPELFERVLGHAELRIAGKTKLEPWLVGSRYLPSGLRAAKLELARMFNAIVQTAGADDRGALSVDDVREAIAAHRRVRDHRLAETAAERSLVERLAMSMRLLVYLLGHAEREAKLATLTTPGELVRALADHHATEGGFVDYARRLARAGHTDDALGLGIARLLAVVDAIRDTQDTRFGPALKRWNEQRTSGHLVPIEQVLEAQGLELLAQCPDAKLLILVMDGMAWGAAVEILLDLREAHYGPLRFSPRQTASTNMPAPMIAALPTMTEVSRAALFAGRLLRVGEKTSTLKDPDRLRAHRGFVKAFGQGPSLLLRTHAEDDAGHITEAARKLVQSGERVVALVVNTVDDILSAAPSYQARYNRQTIKAMAPILEGAREAHRAVLMVADHGHVYSDRPRQIVKVDNADSPRFRQLNANAPTDPRELVLTDEHTHRERADSRVALLYHESDRYRDAHHLGEHGGASLAEVVTPAFLIGADDLHQIVGIEEERNEALQTIAWPVPGWWNLELPAPSVARASLRPERIEDPKRAKGSEKQLTFEPEFGAAAGVGQAASTPRAATATEWARRLSKLYSKEPDARRADLKKVLPLLDLLIAHEGQMSDEVLAGRLGYAQRNIGGLVAILGEFLNIDGYDVVSYNVTSRQVRLEIKLLSELFGEDA